MMPVCTTLEDSQELKEFKRLAIEFCAIVESAPRPIPIPSIFRCCCFRTKKRTSCNFFYNMIAGETRQLGIILE